MLPLKQLGVLNCSIKKANRGDWPWGKSSLASYSYVESFAFSQLFIRTFFFFFFFFHKLFIVK